MKVKLGPYGENQTSSSATTKQKEEGAGSNESHYYHSVQFDCCVDCVFPVFYIQTLDSQVCEVLLFLFYVCIWILIKWDSLLEKGSHENFGISVKIFEIIKKDSIWVGVKINAVYAWWEKVRVLRYGLAKLIEPGTWHLDVVGLTKWLSWIMP